MNGKTQTVGMAELRITRVPEALRMVLRMRALAEDTTLNDLVIQLLQDAMKSWRSPR
jgi:predicted HicB family RNase H-like nuclease